MGAREFRPSCIGTSPEGAGAWVNPCPRVAARNPDAGWPMITKSGAGDGDDEEERKEEGRGSVGVLARTAQHDDDIDADWNTRHTRIESRRPCMALIPVTGVLEF